MHDHQQYIQQAVALSKKAIENKDGGPFGCIVVKDGVVIGQGWNHVEANCDPTAHAEVMAIRDACKKLGVPDLGGCILYTSSEPCPMCMAACYWACIGKVYYANTVADGKDVGYEDAEIYKELRQPVKDRRIEMIHLPNADAKKIFADWKESENAPPPHAGDTLPG